jgi:hypothetical protein
MLGGDAPHADSRPPSRLHMLGSKLYILYLRLGVVSSVPDLIPLSIRGPPASTPENITPSISLQHKMAYDISHIEQLPEEHMETLRAAGIKVRDFAYEPMPNSSKAPEVFNPVPCLIAADWHMRNPDKNHGLLPSPKALFRLIKVGWLTLTDVKRYFNQPVRIHRGRPL